MSDLVNLQGFPMLLAVTDAAINARFADVSVKTHDLPATWELKGGGWTLTVDEFGPPRVDFDTTVANGCRLIMTVNRGCFSYWTLQTDADGNPAFDADGNPLPPVKTELDLAGLEINVETPVDVIRDESFSDEDFQAQALFANLSRVAGIDLNKTRLDEDVQAKVMGTAQSSLQTLIANKLQKIGAEKPDALVFGSVRIPKIDDAQRTTGSLMPTAMTFSVTKDDSLLPGRTGSLNYLLWLGDPQAMPTGGAPVGAFKKSWNQGDDVTLVISDYTLFDKFVLPALQAQYPGSRFDLKAGNSETATPAVAALRNGVGFSAPDIEDAVLEALTLQMEPEKPRQSGGNRIQMDYQYRYAVTVESVKDYYRATGTSYLTLWYEDGTVQHDMETPDPTVKSTEDDVAVFFKAFGRGITIALTFGGMAKEVIDGYAGAAGRASGLGGNLGTSLDGLKDLFKMPGQAVFRYRAGSPEWQFLVNADYQTLQAE